MEQLMNLSELNPNFAEESIYPHNLMSKNYTEMQ